MLAGTAYPKLDAVDRSGHSALSLVFSFRRACCKFEKDKPEGFRISSEGMFGGMELSTPGTFHQIEMLQKDDSEVQFSSGLCGHL